MDYFLNETQFTADDIQKSVHILQKGLDEVRNRINEMTKIGAPIELSIINRSKTEYLKFIRSYAASNAEKKDEKLQKGLMAIEERLKSKK